jgi:hypothetical protein
MQIRPTSAQSDLIGAPEPSSTEAVLDAPNSGYLRTGHQTVRVAERD